MKYAGPAASARRSVVALGLAHGANDMYMAFLPALLPLLVVRLGLNLTQAGLLASTVSVTSQLTQPLFGYLADRVGRRGMVIGAPVLTAASMAWFGLLNSYHLLLVVLILASIGTAAFHPQGASLTGKIARQWGAAAMALFTAGGNIGFGIGPVLVIAVVELFGLHYTWLTLPIGLAAALFAMVTLPRSVDAPEAASSSAEPSPDGLPTNSHAAPAPPPEGAEHSRGLSRLFLPLALLFWVVVLRAATAILFTTFVPLLIERRGAALMLGGWSLLGFSLAGAIGGLVGGWSSDRLGRKWVTAASLALAAPALFLFLRAGGVAAAGLLLASGVCLFSALPVNILMAQELAPRHAGAVSGLVMGFAWGVGGVSTTLMGALADRLTESLGYVGGLARALDIMAALPLLAALLACALPETRMRGANAPGVSRALTLRE
jgi:FSR family fosmidomycin resistance protein-like MFS transporter